MKVSASRKITVEDFPAESREVVKRLSQVMNPVLDQVTQALTSNLTIADNFKGKKYTIALNEDVTTYTVAWDLNEKPTDVHVGSLSLSTGGPPTAVWSFHWVYTDKAIDLTFLGLAALTKHQVTVVGLV